MYHPIQPIVTDSKGVIRFKENKIVRYLLDNSGIDLNQIAIEGFDQEDHEQLAQLIGYSLSGFGELSYVSDITYDTASRMHEKGETEDKAMIETLLFQLGHVRKSIKDAAVALFRIHPDDFNE